MILSKDIYIIVRFIGTFSTFFNKKLTIRFRDPPNMRKVIEKIVKDMPQIKKTLINLNLKELKTNALILLNEREISTLNGMGTILKNGDEIIIIPISHGG